jgi:hypothetical protein
MNKSPLIFISVLVNLGLLAAVVLLPKPAVPASAPDSAPSAATPSNVVQKITRTREIKGTNEIIALSWAQVESPDYKAYIANLRGVGCPEETIRDIVIADISKFYTQKWRTLNPVREYKYWRHGRSSADDPVREANTRKKNLEALLREKRQLVRDLLGVDLAEDGERYADPSFRGSVADMEIYNFLPPEKRQVFREMRDKYEPLFQQLQDQTDPDGFLAPELRTQMTALGKQAEQEMQQALTPEELEQFQLRFSGTAQGLRNSLAGFEPTEEEFKKMFALRKAVDDQFAGANRQDPEIQRQRTEALAKLEQELKAGMTPERFAEYQLSQDNNYRSALSFARAWDLPKEAATSVYSIRQIAEKTARDLAGVSAEQRQAALTGLRNETEKSLRETLGERAFASYRRSQGWLRQLGQ